MVKLGNPGLAHLATVLEAQGGHADLLLVGREGAASRVHRLVVAAASNLLANLANHHDEATVLLPFMGQEVVELLVEVMYTGRCSAGTMEQMREVQEVAEVLGLHLEVEECRPEGKKGGSVDEKDVVDKETRPDMQQTSVEDINRDETLEQEDNPVKDEKTYVGPKEFMDKVRTIRKAGKSLLKSNICAVEVIEVINSAPTAHDKNHHLEMANSVNTVTVVGPTRFSCCLCGKTFSRSNDLRRHTLLHSGERRFSCSFCDMKFVARGDLNKHVRCHTGEKPYLCQYTNCSRAFSQKGDLSKHLRIHLGAKPHECDQCGYKCIQKSDLKNHQLIHTDSKPHCCDSCAKEFRKKNQLKAHRKKVHGTKV